MEVPACYVSGKLDVLRVTNILALLCYQRPAAWGYRDYSCHPAAANVSDTATMTDYFCSGRLMYQWWRPA